MYTLKTINWSQGNLFRLRQVSISVVDEVQVMALEIVSVSTDKTLASAKCEMVLGKVIARFNCLNYLFWQTNSGLHPSVSAFRGLDCSVHCHSFSPAQISYCEEYCKCKRLQKTNLPYQLRSGLGAEDPELSVVFAMAIRTNLAKKPPELHHSAFE